MSNYVVSYDLNGPVPSHKDMDNLLERLSASRARILETVWWVDYSGTAEELCNQISAVLGKEDLLIVVEASNAAWTNLLVDDNSLISAWRRAA